MTWIIAAAALALLLTPVLIPNSEREELDAQKRDELFPEDAFTKLSDGVTHYEWSGPEDGPRVVMVHGFSSPFFIWDRNVAALTEAGFRVLRYDLFGRGLSDRPRGHYDAALYERQLLELLESQGVTEPFDLIGLSMGGGIVTQFTGNHPERVQKLALFAPVGYNNMPPISRLMLVPGLGEWLIRVLGKRMLLNGMLKEVGDDTEAIKILQKEYARQMHFKGYKRALLSTLRHGPMEQQQALYKKMASQERKAMLFWGTEDGVLSYEQHKGLLDDVPFIKPYSIQGGKHMANYQNADEVNPILIDFLKEQG